MKKAKSAPKKKLKTDFAKPAGQEVGAGTTTLSQVKKDHGKRPN